ncbi:2-methylisocitrate lyase-like PEP mutase family enzyme [Bradyrhizobium sp. AZCC 2262]|uniref:isocitrate lyase/PEP mutase family protein n=1 Tax=Bradyrhizobium sp. AZCC 2262 TaxID=3117022 RepID=UPI002FEF5B52
MAVLIDDKQRRLAAQFAQLHKKHQPLVLVNAWDAWSAIECAAAGHQAIATSSHAVAESLGFKDGQIVLRQTVIARVRDMSRVVSVPLSVDFEAGFGESRKKVKESIRLVMEAGAVGINLEDGLVQGQRKLASAEEHCERISWVRAAAEEYNLPLFINARFDGMLLAKTQTESLVDEAIRRSKLYQDAGASGLFVPGLTQLTLVEKLSGAIELPLNVMMWPGCPSVTELAAVGVCRISLGGWPFEFLRTTFRCTLKEFPANSFAYFGHVEQRLQG